MNAPTITAPERPALVAATTITFLRVSLRVEEPGGVTVPAPLSDPPPGEEAVDRVDAVLDVDPWGRPHLPGTSLAGSLRATVAAELDQETAKWLFGRLLPQDAVSETVDAEPSRLWVLGTRPVDALGRETTRVPTRVLAATAIDRKRAAAATSMLRTDEVLEPDTRFEVYLRWDDAAPDDLHALLHVLAAWRPLLGRAVSRGRGRCSVDGVHLGTLHLDEPDDLLLWLTRSGPDLVRALTPPSSRVSTDREPGPDPILLDVPMDIVGPLRVGCGRNQQRRLGARDVKVALLQEDSRGYVIPGSGLKGILRGRTEFILRSVGVKPVPCLDQRCGRCWPCQAFGHGGGRDPAARSVGARARVRVRDAVISDAVTVHRQHIAIDRFTGGARDEHLFTVEALEAGRFRLVIEDLGFPPGQTERLRAMLRLVLQDLDDGLLGIGGGTARGYGSVRPNIEAAERAGTLPDLTVAQGVLADWVGE